MEKQRPADIFTLLEFVFRIVYGLNNHPRKFERPRTRLSPSSFKPIKGRNNDALSRTRLCKKLQMCVDYVKYRDS